MNSNVRRSLVDRITGTRSGAARIVDEPRSTRPADLPEILGAWAELPGCRHVRWRPGQLHGRAHQDAVGPFRAGTGGRLAGRPIEVIEGPITGLHIPAHAEIAIEGEIPPPSVEARDEGPFGEWPGYYSGGTRGTSEPQPVIRVRALYHRDDPILINEAPLWPGAVKHGLPIQAGILWDQLEAVGIQDIAGVYTPHIWW